MIELTAAERLERMLRSLDDSEKKNLWTSTGIDVDNWSLNKERFAIHEKNLANYRVALTAARREAAPSLPAEIDQECTGCGRQGKSVEYFMEFNGPTTICNECFELLCQKASHADE